METVQINSSRFSYQTAAPAARTLDDLRLVHDNYSTQGNFSGTAMRPVIISALVVVAVAGAAIGLHRYSENATEKLNAAASVTDPSVPTASAAQAATDTAAATPATTAIDSAVTDPLKAMTKSEESNAMPLAGQANNHSSESLNPVKAKSSVAAKSAAAAKSAPAKPVVSNSMPAPLATPIPPAQEAAPPVIVPAPIPPAVEEKPIVPVPAPAVDPAPPEPTKQ